MRQYVVFACVTVASLCVASTLAAEPAVTGQEIEALIAQLVSPNKEPKEKFDDVEYPPGYDHTAQKKIKEAFSKLYRIGPPAFPYLLTHSEDTRYSLSGDAGFAVENWTVGRLCHETVLSYLKPHGLHGFARGDGDPRFIPRRPGPDFGSGLQSWLEARKGKPLRELQLEVLNSVIAEEEKRPQDFTAEERDYLKGLRDQLLARDQPLKPAYPFAK